MENSLVPISSLPPPGARVVVALSGGVDSAVTALLLHEAGCVCTGVTFLVLPSSASAMGPRAAAGAKGICDALGMDHIALPVDAAFEASVVTPFVAEYAAGRTPNPCVVCNRLIKFQSLVEVADRVGAAYIATGHYARTGALGERAGLFRGRCAAKDQSYVLANLRQDQLGRACFPLGRVAGKEEVRALAQARGLPCASSADSQEICFLEGRHYADFLEERFGVGTPGPIRMLDGTYLGEHRGLYRHTIGQRRGLGLPSQEPWYVARLDRENNTIFVGRGGQTACVSFTTGPVNWVGAEPGAPLDGCAVQLRYRHRPAPCDVTVRENGLEVCFHTPERGVTPGQWAVFYRDDAVLASGVIGEFALVG